jgi:pimeloyl-ACP methyl ester carboxylesterase
VVRPGGGLALATTIGEMRTAYFNKFDKGGHVAAWEEPELFASEIRAAFQTLR